MHAPGEIRTRNPSKRSAADPHLRPPGYWDRLKLHLDTKKKHEILDFNEHNAQIKRTDEFVPGQATKAQPFYPRGRTRYPLDMALGGSQSRYGCCGEKKILLPLPGFDPRTVQPVASRFIDWAIPAHMVIIKLLIAVTE